MKPLTQGQEEFLLALAGRIVPESQALDGASREAFLRIVRQALSSRPAAVRRQVGVFLSVLRWLPVLRYGCPLERLAPQAQDGVLRWFQDNPLPLFRKGFWGVKTLIFMGYYGRPEAGESLAYRPSTRGNTLLHG